MRSMAKRPVCIFKGYAGGQFKGVLLSVSGDANHVPSALSRCGLLRAARPDGRSNRLLHRRSIDLLGWCSVILKPASLPSASCRYLATRAPARQGVHRALFRPCRAPPSPKGLGPCGLRSTGAVVDGAGRYFKNNNSLIVPVWQAGLAQDQGCAVPPILRRRCRHKIGSPTPRVAA